ncbi:hypothetical protein H0H93_006466 [Arthromyces matolae]|nr:hypothetical protein H0H93_006466 [Arthromyces matolae]
MNSSSVYGFFLRRQARNNRKRPAYPKSCPSMTSSSLDPLPIIEEEEELQPRASTSRSPSPEPGFFVSSRPTFNTQLKLKRRRANLTVADIRLAALALDHSDRALDDEGLLLSTRPAPGHSSSSSPFSSPESSSHPFNSKFLDDELHPPIHSSPNPLSIYRDGWESPTPSMSSCSSSTTVEAQSSLPTTPATSDDESSSCPNSPSFCPVTVKPLVITKHNRPVLSRSTDISIKNSFLSLPSLEEDSDAESDFEWYSQDVSKILTLCSPAPPSFPPSKTRPDSACISTYPPSGTPSEGLPCTQLDPSYIGHRRTRLSIPSSPRVPSASTLPSLDITTRPRSQLKNESPHVRPPPRSSIPADCVLVDNAFAFDDDDNSAFSEDDSPLPSVYKDSPKNMQPSLKLDRLTV